MARGKCAEEWRYGVVSGSGLDLWRKEITSSENNCWNMAVYARPAFDTIML